MAKALEIGAVIVGAVALVVAAPIAAAGFAIAGVGGAIAAVGSEGFLLTAALEVGAVGALSAVEDALQPRPPSSTGAQVDFQANPQAGVPYAIGRTGTGGLIALVDSAGKNSAYLNYVTVLSLGPIKGVESFQANNINVIFDADSGEGAGHQNATTTISTPAAAGQAVLQVGTTAGFSTGDTVTVSLGGVTETRTITRVDQSPKELTLSGGLSHSYDIYAQVTGATVVSGFKNRMWRNASLGGANASYLHWTATGSKDTPADHSGLPTVWTSNCQLSGLAATLWGLEFDAQVYSGGTPKPLNVLLGVFVYDPRLDSTYAGGSGPCRVNDETTWVWSENPYLHGLTWLIGRTSNGVKTMGVHAPLPAIDMAAFVSGANVADANGWKCGGVVSSTDSKWDVLVTILQAGSGTPLKLSAKISCMVNAPLVSLDTLTGADVVGKAVIPNTKPARDRINAIWPRYREEQQGWQIVPTQAPVLVASYVAVDGGQRTKEIEYTLCQSADQVATLARYDIENAREIEPFSLPCKPRWMGYKPGDCITINEPEYGLSGQPVVILSRQVDPATLVTTLTLRTETPGKHAFALGQTSVAPVTPALNGFNPSAFAGPIPGDWAAIGSTVAAADGSTVPVINIAGLVDNVFAVSILSQYALAGSNNWKPWNEVAASSTAIQITGLASSTAYDVALSYRSVKGVVSPMTVITPSGGIETGALVASAIAGGGGGLTGDYIALTLAGASAGAAQALTAADGVQSQIDDAANASLAQLLAATQTALVAEAQSYTPAGLPMGNTVDQHTVNILGHTAIFNILGVVTGNGSGFVLSGASVSVDSQGTSLTQSFLNQSSATGAVASNLANNYLNATSTTGALAALNTSLTTSINQVSSNVSLNYVSNSTLSGALAGLQATIAANYTSAINASVSFEATARANADLAISNAVLGTSSTLNGSTTSAALALSSLATVQGFLGSYASLRVVNGNEATGISVYQSGGGSSLYSGIVFQGNNILIRPASGLGAVQPFYYDATTGMLSLQSLALYGNLVVGGSIVTNGLAANSVTNGMSSSASSSVSGTGGNVTVFSQTINLTYPATLTVIGAVDYVDGGGHASNSHSSQTTILVDGAQLAVNSVPTAPSAIGTLPCFGSISLAAGSHTVTLQANTQSFDSYTYRTLISLWTYR